MRKKDVPPAKLGTPGYMRDFAVGRKGLRPWQVKYKKNYKKEN